MKLTKVITTVALSAFAFGLNAQTTPATPSQTAPKTKVEEKKVELKDVVKGKSQTSPKPNPTTPSKADDVVKEERNNDHIIKGKPQTNPNPNTKEGDVVKPGKGKKGGDQGKHKGWDKGKRKGHGKHKGKHKGHGKGASNADKSKVGKPAPVKNQK